MLIIGGNLSSWFLTRFDTNQAILKALDTWYFRFKKKEVHILCFLCFENKGADQLYSYCTADLCFYFGIDEKNRLSQKETQIP